MVKRNRPYVGFTHDQKLELFRSTDTPTPISNNFRYGFVIGPFNTLRAANWYIQHGWNNPHCNGVNDAERLSKK